MANVKQLFDLSGRVSVITGGATGLGLQMAHALAEAGSAIVICSRKLENCETAAHEIEKLGVKTLAVGCDVTKADQVEALKEATIKKFARVDVLVNNAGRAWVAPPEEMPLERWQQVLDLNITAPFLCSQVLGREMIKAKRGKVINIASILGLVGGGDPGRPATLAYNTSKGGIVSFTRSLAAEWAQHDINVNAIAPGFFPTRMTRGILEMIGDEAARKAPLRRIGGPEDLKGVTALLASDACSFITGQVVAVDGGVTAV